jgi:hypothetical protein
MLDLNKLLIDVFDPQQGEVAAIMVDLPHDEIADTSDWQERREMAERWHAVLAALASKRDFTLRPLLTFPATGGNNADLPANGWIDGQEVNLIDTLKTSTLLISMTQYSATAPLSILSEGLDDFRAASMPGVQPRMEQTALAADYSIVAKRCQAIEKAMRGARFCHVVFSTGHRCSFDLRHRKPEMDDGFLPRTKQGDRIINLPSGETFIVPYEGEIEGVPSWTSGTIPVVEDGETVLFHVADNKIIMIEGEGPVGDRYAELFMEDPTRTNIAEVAFGVNEMAKVSGSVIEDEKAGFHWAYGRSDHLGGVVGVADFRSPETVLHTDIVYAPASEVQVTLAEVVHPDGKTIVVIRDGEYQM